MRDQIVPSIDEMSDALLGMAALYEMPRLLAACTQIIYPIYMRNTVMGFVRTFEALDIVEGQWMNATMFDALKWDGSVHEPNSMAVQALAVLVDRRRFPDRPPTNYSDRPDPNGIVFGQLNAGILLLGAPTMAHILRNAHQPIEASLAMLMQGRRSHADQWQWHVGAAKRLQIITEDPLMHWRDEHPEMDDDDDEVDDAVEGGGAVEDATKAGDAADAEPRSVVGYIPYVNGPVPTTRFMPKLFQRKGS